jgi:hypothetical protein
MISVLARANAFYEAGSFRNEADTKVQRDFMQAKRWRNAVDRRRVKALSELAAQEPHKGSHHSHEVG